MSRYLPNLPKAIAAVLVAGSIFVVIEVASQARTYLHTGQSVFMKLKGESVYVLTEDLGGPVSRTNHFTGGDRKKIASSAFGFATRKYLCNGTQMNPQSHLHRDANRTTCLT